MNEMSHSSAHRASTDEQKRDVIERLYVLWRTHPELRLGQLLGNVSLDIYYEEDFHLLEILEQFYKTVEA